MPLWMQFDLAIWLFVLLGIVVQVVIASFVSRRHPRGAFVITALIFVAQLVVLYGSFIESQTITVDYSTATYEDRRLAPETQERFFTPGRVPEKEDSATLRIATIADWHLGPYKDETFVTRVVKHLEDLDPDLILMPGDFVYGEPVELDSFVPFEKIAERVPSYATLGNHDYNWREQFEYQPTESIPEEFRYADQNTDLLEKLGVTVLRDTDDHLSIEGVDIHIIGQDDWWARNLAPVETFVGTEYGDELTILLQHNPDGAFFQDIPDTIDLIVSGHTHGGQIRLPFIGSVWKLPTQIGQRIDRGWFHIGNEQLLYVTHGIGETGPRARLLAWPEIAVFDISIAQ